MKVFRGWAKPGTTVAPTEPPLRYRRTASGEWVVFGPAARLTVGRVTVQRRDGSTREEEVVRLGRQFDVGGVPHCYGYRAEATTPDIFRDDACDECGRPSKYGCPECGSCSRCCDGSCR